MKQICDELFELSRHIKSVDKRWMDGQTEVITAVFSMDSPY